MIRHSAKTSKTDLSKDDWSTGIPAGMSAKHEKALILSNQRRLTPLKNAALQAGMPALQSAVVN
jgi:hypothetical protein